MAGAQSIVLYPRNKLDFQRIADLVWGKTKQEDWMLNRLGYVMGAVSIDACSSTLNWRCCFKVLSFLSKMYSLSICTVPSPRHILSWSKIISPRTFYKLSACFVLAKHLHSFGRSMQLTKLAKTPHHSYSKSAYWSVTLDFMACSHNVQNHKSAHIHSSSLKLREMGLYRKCYSIQISMSTVH